MAVFSVYVCENDNHFEIVNLSDDAQITTKAILHKTADLPGMSLEELMAAVDEINNRARRISYAAGKENNGYFVSATLTLENTETTTMAYMTRVAGSLMCAALDAAEATEKNIIKRRNAL